MKITQLVAVLLCVVSIGKAQNIVLSRDTVDLGVVYENQPDSAVVYLKNISPFWSSFSIEEVAEFPFYGDTVVQVSFNNQLVLQGDSIAIWVKASPKHNVIHKGSIVLKTGGLNGQVAIPYKFQGRYSKSYYTLTENKTETQLRSQLASIITSGYTSLSYNSARDEMYSDLDNVNGDVECVYTGRTATFNTRAGATTNNFNCEHTFPQGFFNSASPMKSDIHHLFPTDITANSQRGNLPFGTVSNPSWQNGGSKKNSTHFEPRDTQKGTTARAMMYFVLRYQDYANHFAGQETILRQWHNQYPPSQKDVDRNNGIFQLQNNRNPFVDYPQFTERITNLVGSTSQPYLPNAFVFHDINLTYDTLNAGNLIYSFYAVNTGNQPLTYSNFQVTNSNLQFANGTGVSATLNPGDALKVDVSYPTNVDFTGEQITYSVGGSGSTIYITIKSLVPVFSVDDNIWNPAIVIGNSRISWEQEDNSFDWKIYDMAGRLVKSGSSEEKMVDFQTLQIGVYTFIVQADSKVKSFKFFVTNS